VCIEDVCRQLCSGAQQCLAGQGCVVGLCDACGADADCTGVGVCQGGACVVVAKGTLDEPSDVATSLLGPYDVQLTWRDNSDTETGYVIERCLGVACGGAGALYTDVATLPPDSVEFSDLGLVSETIYFYRVSLAFGASRKGAVVSGIATAPAAPTRVEVLETDRAPRVLTVRWLDLSSSETGYRVSFVRQCSTCSGETPVSVLVGANATSAELKVLSPSTTYEITVEAMKDMVASARVSVIASTTKANDPLLTWGPAAPGLAEVSGQCRLSAPASVALDPAATLQATLGTVQGATVLNATNGVTAELTDFTPGARGVTWTVTDSLFGTSTLAKSVTLLGPSARLQAPPNLPAPEAKLGRDVMAGRQPLLAPLVAPCQKALGQRGSLAAGDDHQPACARRRYNLGHEHRGRGGRAPSYLRLDSRRGRQVLGPQPVWRARPRRYDRQAYAR